MGNEVALEVHDMCATCKREQRVRGAEDAAAHDDGALAVERAILIVEHGSNLSE